MEPYALALFAAALVLNSATPGPSIAALVSRIIARGWRDVTPFVAAMWLGEVLWLSLAMVGLSALAETFHTAFVVLKYLGAAYLAYLAWRLWCEPVAAEGEVLPERASSWSMFGAGTALTLGNLKIMVFYVALLPGLVDLSNASVSLWAVIATITVASLAAVDLAWIVAAHHARRLLRTPRAVRMANRAGAATLGGAAAVIVSR